MVFWRGEPRDTPPGSKFGTLRGGLGYQQRLDFVRLTAESSYDRFANLSGDLGTRLRALQVRSDVRPVEYLGFEPKPGEPGRHFASLEEWCDHMYLPHLAGWAYSAGLKYKLLCGSMVIAVRPPADCRSKYRCADSEEFWYRAARDAGLWVDVDLGEPMRIERFWEAILAAWDVAEGVGGRARNWANRYLGSEGLDCYWYGVVERYVGLLKRGR